MKKLQLKKEVITRLESEKSKMVFGGDQTTTYGDSGGTLCNSCGFCPVKSVGCKPVKESEGCTTSVVVCC